MRISVAARADYAFVDMPHYETAVGINRGNELFDIRYTAYKRKLELQ